MNSRNRLIAESFGGWRKLAAAASVLAVLGLGSSVGAQDAAEAPAEPPRSAPAPVDAPDAEPREDAAESPRSAGDASDDVFVPTEEISADEEVVFPVDI